jgi:hypothetical protein
MTNLTLELASIVLSSRHMLEAIAEWVRGRSSSLRPSGFNDILNKKLKQIKHYILADQHYHQVDLACEHLKSSGRGISSLYSNHGALPPESHAGNSGAGHVNESLFQAALRTLTDTVLCDDHGRLALRWDSLSVTQGILRLVEVSQLSAYAMAQRCVTASGYRRKPGGDELRVWARDAVIPPVACGMIAELGQRGLVEVHRHMNVSLQPILIWSELMGCDRLPDNLNPGVRRWIRVAQQLRTVLIRLLYTYGHKGRVKHVVERENREYNLIRVLQSIDMNADPLTIAFSSHAIGRWTGYFPNEVPSEPRFLCDLYCWMLEAKSDLLSAAVHAYCLLQNLVRAELIMPLAGGGGLDRFVDLFGSHPIRDEIDREAHHRLVQAYRTGRVFWLEARMTPKNPADRINRLHDSLEKRKGSRNLLKLFSSHNNRNLRHMNRLRPIHRVSLPAVGLVFHFVKKKCESITDLRRLKRVPVRNYQERYEAWQQANAIAELMDTDEKASVMVLGFDVCGSETCTSMDVYAAQVRYLNLLGRPAASSSLLRYPHPEAWYRKRITRITCHAGEDFDHILTGLRHIDEAVEFYTLQKDDRIGHATALGIDPDKWLMRGGPRRVLFQGEWLDDLVWFHQWLAEVGGHGDVRHQVSEQITKLARTIYRYTGQSDYFQVEELWAAWKMRSEDPPERYADIADEPVIDPLALGRLRYAQMSRRAHLRQINYPRARKLWWDYHTDSGTRREWYKTIEVELNPRWNQAVEIIQKELTKKLVTKHIVIEVNPSSNLTLGPFDEMKEHPVFRWVDPRTDFASNNNPMVVVGTDDPAAFATELIHEYAFLGRAAEELGATQRQISAWLEHLRQSGIKYSFFPRESFENPNDNKAALLADQ